jgi:methyl-accepting chemotaxis protein
MSEIVDSIRRVTAIVAEISTASQEQTSGIEQINAAITQMDQVTQQNASLVEEAAAASSALQDQAGKLAQSVSVFKLGGTHARLHVVPATAKILPSAAGVLPGMAAHVKVVR